MELNPFFLFSFCCNVCIFSLGRFERRVADIKHRALNNKKRTSLPASRNRLLYWHGAGRDGADTHLFYSLFPHVFFLPSQRACPFDGEDVWRFLILCVWIKKTDAGGIVFLLGSFLCDEKEREREKKNGRNRLSVGNFFSRAECRAERYPVGSFVRFPFFLFILPLTRSRPAFATPGTTPSFVDF